VDIEPIKLRPTWNNNRSSRDVDAKRLDHFMILDTLIQKVEKFRTWVGGTRLSDHFPIWLEFENHGSKLGDPFKFNPRWITEDEFQAIIKGNYAIILLIQSHWACEQFSLSLKHVKERWHLGRGKDLDQEMLSW
jgi:hypothetical protein